MVGLGFCAPTNDRPSLSSLKGPVDIRNLKRRTVKANNRGFYV